MKTLLLILLLLILMLQKKINVNNTYFDVEQRNYSNDLERFTRNGEQFLKSGIPIVEISSKMFEPLKTFGKISLGESPNFGAGPTEDAYL